ncbi:alpha/beta fold hydrolase [Streptomyces antimicrobicus]|uniref:Alpha/beta hydrolase n=1 Tax=Streptomyces antimicrobicus TaxID=2883108 RepID=A0ABS8B5G8_9ACTN|nr:alpha/beta fold hydrolase [Streptomyces antimicrobicus]MCB5179814.1 alpha/beta hydrolase [Streptomyces antimicrobicus]
MTLGSARPGLLLVHGAGGGIEANYGPIMEGLSARHTVVGVDLPGAGNTPRSPVPLDADALVDEMVAAADERGLDRFSVSGYSLGGPLAVRLATRHPERVGALVLSATFAYADTRTELAASIWQQLYESGQHVLMAEYLNLMALAAPTLNALTPAQVRAAAAGLAPLVPTGTAEHVDLVRRIDVRQDLAGIAVPTLVVVTTLDPLVAPGLQRDLAAAVPGAEVAELPTGHLPFAENPAEWLRLITDFLERF